MCWIVGLGLVDDLLLVAACSSCRKLCDACTLLEGYRHVNLDACDIDRHFRVGKCSRGDTSVCDMCRVDASPQEFIVVETLTCGQLDSRPI